MPILAKYENYIKLYPQKVCQEVDQWLEVNCFYEDRESET